jgi:Flp pilus assembly protein CpaB
MKLSQRRLARPSLGGLMATRQGALMLALICAVCAAGILVFALGRYKTSVQTPVPQATVLVATGEIQKGTSGAAIAAQQLFKSTPVVATQLAAGAISNASALVGTTAQSDILPGQQLTSTDFAASVGVTGLLAPNQRAVSITLDEPHGDTDILQPGDRVDIYTDFIGAPLHGWTEVLMVSNALVLKPASAVPVSVGGKTITGSSLVIAVTSSQGPEIGYALDNGKTYLALRPANATAPTVPLTTLGTIVAAAPAQTSPTANSTTSSNPTSASNPKTTRKHS